MSSKPATTPENSGERLAARAARDFEGSGVGVIAGAGAGAGAAGAGAAGAGAGVLDEAADAEVGLSDPDGKYEDEVGLWPSTGLWLVLDFVALSSSSPVVSFWMVCLCDLHLATASCNPFSA
jgi:hypothetical protein